jgi:hypothetical protein
VSDRFRSQAQDITPGVRHAIADRQTADPLGEGVYSLVKKRAAEEGRSLSAALRELLAQYAAGDRVA